ncbi:low temperature requirement protein A [Streptacidiphilus fuscans]|uniref:Low temperature requirement protein A n=1 Tax=Streptacidiphilus fuscans TaxID=2789292 RepID=A0A931B5I8_9ACTN|nr:low temperature requirement protein A [Streptacidiphilus fuscans]MBF9070764.1 low temperature requirement protein A [Streptacidiphilus fuscans]
MTALDTLDSATRDAPRAGGPRSDRIRLRLRKADAAHDRSTSPLEMFFDLVFMVAVAELVSVLLHDPTWAGAARYTALFVPVWWSWVSYTFYSDRFDNDDRAYRLIVIAAMAAILFMSMAIPGAFSGSTGAARMALSYAASRLILVGLYARAHRHAHEARPLTRRYLLGFGTGAAVWLVSVFVPPPVCYVLWAVGLAVDMLTPLLSAAAIARVPFDMSHIPERFGLFTIIVLGEVVALNAAGITSSRLQPMALAAVAGAFLVAAAQWWLCFDFVDASPLRQWRLTGQAYVYGHLVIHAGIAATGVGGLLATEAANTGRQTGAWQTVLCWGVAAFLLGIGTIHQLNMRPWGDPRAWCRLGLGTAFLVLGTLDVPMRPPVLELILICGLAGQILVESRVAGPVPAAAAHPHE